MLGNADGSRLNAGRDARGASRVPDAQFLVLGEVVQSAQSKLGATATLLDVKLKNARFSLAPPLHFVHPSKTVVPSRYALRQLRVMFTGAGQGGWQGVQHVRLRAT